MFQLLLCPVADLRLTTASWKDYDGYMFTREEFAIVRDFYVPHEEEQANPSATPGLASNLHGLPPALVITAECDPVRDGGERYGQRLLEAGVPTTVCVIYPATGVPRSAPSASVHNCAPFFPDIA